MKGICLQLTENMGMINNSDLFQIESDKKTSDVWSCSLNFQTQFGHGSEFAVACMAQKCQETWSCQDRSALQKCLLLLTAPEKLPKKQSLTVVHRG